MGIDRGRDLNRRPGHPRHDHAMPAETAPDKDENRLMHAYCRHGNKPGTVPRPNAHETRLSRMR